MIFRKFFNKQVDIYLRNLKYFLMDFPTSYDKHGYPHRVVYLNQKYNKFIEVDKHDTNEYWGTVYRIEPNTSVMYMKLRPVAITDQEMYGIYNKVRALNKNTHYKQYKIKDIDREIKNCGYMITNSNFPLYVSYTRYNMDGNEAIKVYIYREKDEHNNYRHVLRVEDGDGLAVELNEKELYLFYKKLQSCSIKYNINKEIADRLVLEGRFD